MIKNAFASIIAAILTIFLCVPLPAFADNQAEASPAAEQVNVSLVSDEEKLAGCHYKAYKLMSATFTGPFADTSSLIYAPGVDAAFILPDNPTAAITNVEGSVELDNKGNSNLKWDYLRGLADRAASTLSPAADLVVDTGSFALPGTGYYLFVMDDYQNIDNHDDNITAPFFTTPIEEDEDIEILIKRNEGTDPFWLAKMVQGYEEPSKRATLTAIYQPDNIPEDVRVAAELAEQEQKGAMEEELQGGGLAFSLLPVILIVGGIVVLNVLMKSRKKKSKGNGKASQKGKTKKDAREEASQPSGEPALEGDEVKVLSGSHLDD